MPNRKYDPRAHAAEQRERHKWEKANAEALDQAKLRNVNLEQLFGIEPHDRPFWPGSSVHLAVGALRPMRTDDSVLGKPGLLGDLVASRSSYVLDIPNYAPVAEWLEPSARVEFIVGDMNKVVGVREERVKGKPTWIFIVSLTRQLLDRLHTFAMNVDQEQQVWWSPSATVQIRCDGLVPLPSPATETTNFIALVSAIQFGTAEPQDVGAGSDRQ